MIRWLFAGCGIIALTLGIIGIFLPILPTTPFVLLAAGCWAKSSPHFHHWLSRHRYFGPIIKNWETRRAIPKKAKYLAFSMMAFSCLLLWVRFPMQWWIAIATMVCISVAFWMWRLPDA
ncbi:membrane protein [Neisseria arctica]|uniref:Membrane protein n=1 Tax=Neisseria arctica TaxID=1470200 RepID=A0A0J0YQR4_9NEIS|nr:YbaN family protein [Neisseria arctica]KLT72471.1 membrane protein [Neisseria arctica]UOO86371.1 YbaN family protein [Neisseria arctica]